MSHSSFPKNEQSGHESSSDEEDEVSFINPFATGRSGSMRHRYRVPLQPSRTDLGRFDPYNSSSTTNAPMNSLSFFINENDYKNSSDQVATRLLAQLNDRTPSAAAIESSLSARGTAIQQQQQLIPGTAGFLEMEEEPSSVSTPPRSHLGDDGNCLHAEEQEPIQTISGLLLTHRHITPMPRHPQPTYDGGDGNRKKREVFRNVPDTRVLPGGEAFEVESGHDGAGAGFGTTPFHSISGPSSALVQVSRLLSYVRMWNAAFCVLLLVGTGVILHSIRHEANGGSEMVEDRAAQTPQINSIIAEQTTVVVQPLSLASSSETNRITEQIILVPMPNVTQHHRRMVAQPEAALVREPDEEPHHHHHHHHDVRQTLHALREEFEQWLETHNKAYHSQDEKEHRFKVWHDNHHRTIEKNKRHGPCKLTNQPVFGSNHFKDLTSEEFKSQYLTGYSGPRADHSEQPLTQRKNAKTAGNEKHRRVSTSVPGHEQRADPKTSVKRHPSVQERYVEAWKATVSGDMGGRRTYTASYQSSSTCKFYDVSCWLRWFMYTYGYGIGGTMEPKYDSDSYPSAIDWREFGVVTDVHSQSKCGACWAITAVETIESAYAISSGTLMDLAETEVIVCDDSCEMCNGGWPQNAYEFNMEHGGLLQENAWSYDGDFLYQMTMAKKGESDTYDTSYFESYTASMCPSGSGDKSNSNAKRYAKVKGYGYATDRCICYTDGTGCDCDEQDERTALLNVATYGPAAVCLEASTWQDYAGGIITSEVGCSAAFLDMNHCVQAVGYAYVDMNEDGDGDENNSGSDSRSGSGSRDDGNREGYWIIRNQWSTSWGMYGYIYVAMGENTCGVLNDMTIVYL